MSHLQRYLFSIAISLVLASCAVGPDFHSPAAPNASRYTERPIPAKTVSTTGVAGKAQHLNLGQDISAQWWTLFHSPALNQLISRGLTNSPTVAAAQAALRQAQQNLKAEIGAGLFPSIDTQISAQRERFSPSTLGASNGIDDIFNLYNTSVNVSYTLDIFGGIRRQIESSAAQVDYQRFQLEAAYLTLAANIATTAINQASLRAQIAATHELINAQQNQLQITQQQFQLGGVSKADILSQQTLLAQTQATLPPLEKNLAQFRDGLAVLVGSLPGQAQLPNFNLDALRLPEQLPLSLPSQLVRQRPDVRASESLLHVASANVGVATANMLPQFNLTGNFGVSANTTQNLFSYQNGIWTIGGEILQPIFQGGALNAQRKAAIAAYDEAAAQYQQVVLQAFQNVADALHAIEFDAKTLRAQTQAEKAADDSYKLVRQQYKLGAVSYLALLDAQRQYQQARIDRIQAQAARYVDTAALFQALGGGWWNRVP